MASAEEPKQGAENKNDKSLEENMQRMFDKTSEYLRSEAGATCEDYKVLERLNQVTAERYEGMTRQAVGLNESLGSLFECYAGLEQHIMHIDEIDAGVRQLETTVRDLDVYCRMLEERFNQRQMHS